MAQQTIVELVDDLDGKSLAAETVEFSLDGTHYAIDLTEQHAERFRKALERYVTHARRTGGRRRPRK